VSKILIIEDDRSLVDVLAYNLRQVGYEVSMAYDGMDGLSQAQLKAPDLIVLDLMLPVMDGLEVCRRLRSDPHTRDVLILMLTAKTEESDQLVGFSVGADDYVTKPYSIRVLMQRIKALERRRRSADTSDPDVVSLGSVTVDRRRHQASVSGRTLNLTRSEFRLLDTLIRQPGRAYSRAELISAALGDDAIVLERTIDVHIRAVRRKLEDVADVIETVRGVGYRYRDPSMADELVEADESLGAQRG
jgi:two-component system phosphate regulon response regulator PhoB